jgi:hypothetical protein
MEYRPVLHKHRSRVARGVGTHRSRRHPMPLRALLAGGHGARRD